jgi:hypothetical protein
MLAATSSGASLASASDPDVTARRPASEALGGDAIAERGNVTSDRDVSAEGGASLDPTAAELETIILRTLSAADLQALVTQAAGGAVLETNSRVRELGAELDLRQEALARMFEMLGRQDVPPEQLAEVLAEIVARHKSLLERVQFLEASDPRAAELRDAVAAAIETAEYDQVDALRAEAEAIEFAGLRQLLEAIDQRILNAAAIYAPSGAIVGTPLGYGRAAVNGALLQGGGRADSEGPSRFVPSDGFCQRHPEHRLCERMADSSPLCDRLPNHPLCEDGGFCRRHPDHKRCEEPPSPS